MIRTTTLLPKLLFLLLLTTGLLLPAHNVQARYTPFLFLFDSDGLGMIAGKITGDLNPVKGVRVVLIRHDEMVDEKFTDEDGNYSFPYLTPDCYDVRGTKDGYRTHVITHIPVRADRVTRTNFYLPKFNNNHMPSYPLIEEYKYPKRFVKDMMREDNYIDVNRPLPTVNE